MSMGASTNEQISAEVKRRVDELQSKSFPDLESLPETNTQTLEVASARVTMTVYRTHRPNGDLLVVVQASREFLWGIYHTFFVRGFVASVTGAKSKAAEELLWEYT